MARVPDDTGRAAPIELRDRLRRPKIPGYGRKTDRTEGKLTIQWILGLESLSQGC